MLMSKYKYDAVIVGSGPNGLSAAIELAKANLSVLILEKSEIVGGGMRSAELTLPGFIHDICSSIHPMGAGSPFFSRLPLHKFGLEWIYPPIQMAHPFDDGSAALLYNSLNQTAETLGSDAEKYKKIIKPICDNWDDLRVDILAPLRIPEHPVLLAKFGFHAIQSCLGFCDRNFTNKYAKGLIAGLSAHSFLPLDKIITASFGLVLLTAGHTTGWPIAKGGSQCLVKALQTYYTSLGGEIRTGYPVNAISDIPSSRAVLFDLTPRQIIEIMGDKLPVHYRNSLHRYRYGSGVFKIDWAIEGNIRFKNPILQSAGVIHIGSTIEEIALGEEEVWEGRHPEKPFVLLSQQSAFDPSRAPEGKNTVWGYCHVPHGSTFNMTERIENQVERFAPGFRDKILSRHVMSTEDFQQYNSNYVGGDIIGGIQDIWQLFTRPVISFSPYSIPVKGYYICSSSTPPGGGVHGMCGYHAARTVLKDIFKLK